MGRKQKILGSILNSVGKPIEFIEPKPGQKVTLSGKRLGIPLAGKVIEVDFFGERLHIQEDVSCDGSSSPNLRVYNPDLESKGLSLSLTLAPDERLYVSRHKAQMAPLFEHPHEALKCNLKLLHAGKYLVFHNKNSEKELSISNLDFSADQSENIKRRISAIDRVISIYGGALKPLPPDNALAILLEINEKLSSDSFRPLDDEKTAGGLVDLPPSKIPVVVGDLHGNVDNLLKILSENSFLQTVENGEGLILFLGDLVQPNTAPYDDMEGSVLIMDILFKLKLKFPEGVFFLRGNHDSFSDEVTKDGVPQGILWRRTLEKSRGPEYREQMEKFYELCPVVARSKRFVACHAGPPMFKFSLDMVINARRYPKLVHELTWNRVRRPGYPSGYTASDVRRFRKKLKVEKELPLLVGHTPYTQDATCWPDVAGIENHHIFYSAKTDQIAVYFQFGGRMVPQIYNAEPLLKWTRKRARSKE